MLSTLIAVPYLVLVPIAGAEPGSNKPLIDDARLQTVGMYRYWQAHLPLAPGDALEKAYLVDESLYFVTDWGSCFALTAKTGLVRWAVKLTGPDHQIFRPAHIRTADGTGPVVIATGAKVFIYDRFSGDLIRSFTPPFASGSPAVGYDGMLFIGSADGRFYSLRIDHPRADEPFKLWEVVAGGPLTAAPSLYDHSMVLFASQGGTVFSCRAADKTLNWGFRADGPVIADPTVDRSGAYVASIDRSLYKLHLGTGQVLWRTRMPQPLTEGPVVAAHTVFQFCTGNGISAIDTDNGVEKWRIPNGRTFVAHTRGGDTIFTDDRRLDLVDHNSGDLQYSIEAPSVIAAVSNTSDDAVYLFGQKGRVLCARLDSVPYLRRQQIIAARERLHLPPADAARAQRKEGDESATDKKTDTALTDPFRSRREPKQP
jgi:outer membrane protein assembly factor BamB